MDFSGSFDLFYRSIIRHVFVDFFFRMVFPSTLIICNDCMAYFWSVFPLFNLTFSSFSSTEQVLFFLWDSGIALGKKLTSRPFIHLSPNKTWEGFVGAFFCTLVFSWLVRFFFLFLEKNIFLF